MAHVNKAVPDVHDYFPSNEPVIGSVYPSVNQDVPKLFQPLTLRGTTFKNRIFTSPMCQYSSRDGHATDWHFVHVGGLVTRGTGAVCMEATSVLPEGRISPEDAGLWTDTQIPPLKRIVEFAHVHDTKIGVQLSHAGRKATTLAPWIDGHGSHTAQKDENGWPDNVYGPSDLSWGEGYPQPKALTEEGLRNVEDAFVSAVERCKTIGYDFLEIHAAHGYLLHSFLSPLSNVRSDNYGGQPLENRIRFPLAVIKRVRQVWPDKPLFVRISASDWAEGPEKDETTGEWKSWGIQQSILFVKELEKIGVDLVDASSGGNWKAQKIPHEPGYQVHFAAALKVACPNLTISTVGLITTPEQAETYLKEGKADVVSLARELIRTPHWPMLAAQQLGVKVKPANQYERGWPRILA